MSTADSNSMLGSAPSVPLNRPSHRNANSGPKMPVWPLNESLGPQPTPLPSKCARDEREDGVCCKDLKGDDERTLIDPDVVRDV
jgi:hypothetical protein